jgi:hypothetical protein
MLDDELKAEKVELDVAFKDVPYMFISSVAQQGLTELKTNVENAERLVVLLYFNKKIRFKIS